MQHDAAGSLKLHRLFEVRRSLKVTEPCPNPPPSSHRPGSRSRTSARRSTADGIPSRRSTATLSRSPRRSSRTGTTSCARSCAIGRPARGSGSSRRSLGNDRWAGRFRPAGLRRWQFTIEAWVDRYATPSTSRPQARRGPDRARRELSEAEALFGPGEPRAWRGEAETRGAKDRARQDVARQAARGRRRERLRARFGAWYELFRAAGAASRASRRCCRAGRARLRRDLPPPIHPIGETNRKGRNNARRRGGRPREPVGDRGRGRARGGPSRARDAEGLRQPGRGSAQGPRDRARLRDPDLARPPLADRASGWFNRRPDGTLKYAENPPKRYQDIYNVNFDSEDWPGLWEALKDVVMHWCRHGVRAYRVDNPHTSRCRSGRG